MNYWWVNQKQTYSYEVPGGYMWSPKLNAAGRHIRPYDLMRKLVPGDIVFSYANALLKAVGVVKSYCYEFPKPSEFGAAGLNWAEAGWRVDVDFKELAIPVRTINHINVLRDFLPVRHSPLKSQSGFANESYLFHVSRDFALALAHLLDGWVVALVQGNYMMEASRDRSYENLVDWENRVEEQIATDDTIEETERSALVLARRGQGKYRDRLLNLERACRVTRVDRPNHLIASHTKPWRDCTNSERLDPENGFMLTPTVDHLFDKGFISFEDNGDLLISPVAHLESISRMKIPLELTNVGQFSSGQKAFLQWHREFLLLQ
ncbi:MAG: HNH endonuclease [Pseudomonadales bacterium]|nr:HNH endonuclease [Pseudomonadales bacterium]